MAEVLSDEQVNERLRELPRWEVVDGKLHRQFEFADFVEAFGFMSRVALVAEKMFHHPDWSNSWNTVDMYIVNHAEGGITDKCFQLASKVTDLAG